MAWCNYLWYSEETTQQMKAKIAKILEERNRIF